jgi:cytochrome c oxidase cbb3-type subunit I
MNSSPITSVNAAPSADHSAVLLTADIDRSCRFPVAALFSASLIWFLLGGLLAVVASIKMHSAAFLAGPEWLTFGRVRPASFNILAYGFATQALLASAVWIIARLSRRELVGLIPLTIGAVFWNIAVLMGVLGIFVGDNTGREWLEFPRYATPILFFSFVMMGIWSIITFHFRREREVYVSQWYLIAALLWFPWVYSIAQLSLIFGPTRGVIQAVINGWYMHNVLMLWFSGAALGIVFYFIPKLAGRPLHSRQLALFAFWLLAVFGTWGGVAPGTPVPKWLPSVTIVFMVLTLLSVMAVAINLHFTLAGAYSRARTDIVLRAALFSGIAYIAGMLLYTIGFLRGPNRILQFTLYHDGVTHLFLYGVVGMAVSAALYYILPRLTDCAWPNAGAIRRHFWMAAIGVALTVLPLLLGGWIQGQGMNNESVPFLQVIRRTIPFQGLNTLGLLILLAGYALLAINVGRILMNCCCGAETPAQVSSRQPARKV